MFVYTKIVIFTFFLLDLLAALLVVSFVAIACKYSSSNINCKYNYNEQIQQIRSQLNHNLKKKKINQNTHTQTFTHRTH